MKVLKFFGKKPFVGTVESIDVDKDSRRPMYVVKYEDGDGEDLFVEQLAPLVSAYEQREQQSSTAATTASTAATGEERPHKRRRCSEYSVGDCIEAKHDRSGWCNAVVVAVDAASRTVRFRWDEVGGDVDELPPERIRPRQERAGRQRRVQNSAHGGDFYWS